MSQSTDNLKSLPLHEVRTNGGTRCRENHDDEYTHELATHLTNGGSLPPVTVFNDGSVYWLVDGHYRHAAYRAAGITHIPCIVTRGSIADARLAGAASNVTHGLRRSIADRRKAALLVLMECPDWKDNQVAKHTSVDPRLVADVRRLLLAGTAHVRKQTAQSTIEGDTVTSKSTADDASTRAVAQEMIQRFTKRSTESGPLKDKIAEVKNSPSLVDTVRDSEAQIRAEADADSQAFNEAQRSEYLRGLKFRLKWCRNAARKAELPDELVKVIERAFTLVCEEVNRELEAV